MNVADVRHLSGITGCFAVSESEYIGAYRHNVNSAPFDVLVHSSIRELVEQEQNIFDDFWSRAIAAEQKIREIEEEDANNIEVIQNPVEIRTMYANLIKSAKSEIMLLIPSINAFEHELHSGTMQLLTDVAKQKETVVKCIMPTGNYSTSTIGRLFLEGIDIRFIEAPSEIAFIILLVDKSSLLAIEMIMTHNPREEKNPMITTFGSGTYSDNKSTVMSYIAMFQMLWKQAEVHEKLKAHDKMQLEFINIAAHELSTPIQPILGVMDLYDIDPLLLKAAAEEEDEVRIKKQHLRLVGRNAARLARLSSDILDASRIESNTLALNIDKKVDLIDLVKVAIRDIKKQVPDGNIEFATDFQDVKVDVDRYRISQVLANLLNNAIRFTGKGTILVTVKKSNSSDQVEVVISDSGKGIDPQIMPRLFQKFASNIDAGNGTGLGLYISKAIIDAHGGRIWGRNNEDGKGASFGFIIPIEK